MRTASESASVNSSRRAFLKTSATMVGGAIATTFRNVPAVHAAGSDEIRIGLIGCGDRGTGAVENAFNAAPGVKLVAMADVFKDHLDEKLKYLSQFKEKVDVPADRQLVGFGAFERLLALDDVNYVILARRPASAHGSSRPRWRRARASSPKSPWRWMGLASAWCFKPTKMRRLRASTSAWARSGAISGDTSRP